MQRNYSRTLKCSHKDCKEIGFYTFNTKRDLSEHYKRISAYTCLRHKEPLSVLGLDNLTTTNRIVCKTKILDEGSPLGKFWQEERDFGTNKFLSAFQYGNGYKAYANDFPEGTEITITAVVSLPDANV